jgi:hypothetical protein
VTAYHEAGHAVMAFRTGRSVLRISIMPEEGRCGHVAFRPRAGWDRVSPGQFGAFRGRERWIEREILILLCGFAAESRFTGRNNYVGAGEDYEEAFALAEVLHPRGLVRDHYLVSMLARARAAVQEPEVWVQIEALAAALLARPVLSPRAARRACLGGLRDEARIRTPREGVSALEAEYRAPLACAGR